MFSGEINTVLYMGFYIMAAVTVTAALIFLVAFVVVGAIRFVVRALFLTGLGLFSVIICAIGTTSFAWPWFFVAILLTLPYIAFLVWAFRKDLGVYDQ